MKRQISHLNIEVKKKKKKRKIKNSAIKKSKIEERKLKLTQTSRKKLSTRAKAQPRERNPRIPNAMTEANRKIRATKTYHLKKFGDVHLKNILNAPKGIKPSDKAKIVSTANQIFSLIDFIVDKKLGNHKYLFCIRRVLKEMQAFLKKAATVNYNLGVYIITYGFDKHFVPETVLVVGSPQWADVIDNINSYLSTCDPDLKENPHGLNLEELKQEIKRQKQGK